MSDVEKVLQEYFDHLSEVDSSLRVSVKVKKVDGNQMKVYLYPDQMNDEFESDNLLYLLTDAIPQAVLGKPKVKDYYVVIPLYLEVLEPEEAEPIVISSRLPGERKKLLGRGTYGKVFLYQQREKSYAIKIQSLFSDNDLKVATLRETVIMRRLYHPNITPLLKITITNNKLGLVMPARASDLDQLIKDNDKLDSESVVKKRVYDLILAVAHLHSRNVLHRDLKPPNILYNSDDDRLEIIDFGSAKVLGCDGAGLSDDVTTIWYRAPEVLLGDQHYSYPVDVWAVGVIIYNILNHKHLFTEDNEHNMLTSIYKMFGLPRPIHGDIYPYRKNVDKLPGYKKSKFRPDLRKFLIPDSYPSEWFELVQKALILDPEQRATIFELLANPLFDSIRRDDEPTQFTCLDNLYLLRLKPLFNPFTRGKEITMRKRMILFDWLMAVHHMFKLENQTYFLAVSWIDQYIPADTSIQDLQAWGVVGLYLANVYHERYPAELNDFVLITDNAKTNEQLKVFIKQFLKIAEYDLVSSTALDFLKEYSKIYDEKLLSLAIIFLYAESTSEGPFIYESYQQALWAIHHACLYYEVPYQHEDLLPISEMILFNDEIITDEVKNLMRKSNFDPEEIITNLF